MSISMQINKNSQKVKISPKPFISVITVPYLGGVGCFPLALSPIDMFFHFIGGGEGERRSPQ